MSAGPILAWMINLSDPPPPLLAPHCEMRLDPLTAFQLAKGTQEDPSTHSTDLERRGLWR